MSLLVELLMIKLSKLAIQRVITLTVIGIKFHKPTSTGIRVFGLFVLTLAIFYFIANEFTESVTRDGFLSTLITVFVVGLLTICGMNIRKQPLESVILVTGVSVVLVIIKDLLGLY